MSDGENNASNGLKEILEGGLPQALAGPAGKAISRLIGAATDIPAAWLEARAQQIRDQTEAKSQVSQKLAGLVAEKAVTDPALVERAMDGMVAKAYRTQVNKEAVAAIAAQDLLEDPPRQEVADIKEDWMNKFARYAEDASSDDLRTTFGKLLATEVRDPGKVAPSTLHFVTMLEPETARLIARVMPFASANGIAFLDAFDPRLHHLEIKMLEHAGFWSSGTTYTPKFSENGQFVEHFLNNKGIGVKGEANKTVATTQVCVLTRAGRDLIAAVKPDFVIEAIATCFAKGGQASAMHELQSNVGDTETSYTKLRDLSYLIPESK